ncbi:DGQHR domain-containing protein [Empedobacter falsenii]
MENKFIESDFIKVKQPLGEFFVGKLRFEDLLKISYSDVRRIEKSEQNGYETYFGIQRKLSDKRVKEISDYVTTMDATFPSSVLLAINQFSYDDDGYILDDDPNIIFDKSSNKLKIKKIDNIAHIIDGQHRVFGLKRALEKNGLFDEEIQNFELIVTVFVNMDDEDQAMVFSTINKSHTKVNQSLVYDLFDLAKTRSPQRCAHNIVKLLNERSESPFYNKVKMLGIADDFENETIAQATLADLIVKYISKNPTIDRDYLKRGKKLELYNGNYDLKYIFRDWFIDNEEGKIARVLWNYFTAVSNKWKIAWTDNSYILSKSTGVISLMKFLKDIYMSKEYPMSIISIDDFSEIFNRSELNDEDFKNNIFPSGAVGQNELYKKFKNLL